MRIAILAAASVMLAACLSSQVEPAPSPDLAGTQSPSPDMAGMPPAPDLAGADLTPGAPQPFGASCVVDGDCQSGMCRQFRMGTVHFCTQPCTVATQATDCPSPPSTGTCTNNGYCKF